MATPYQVMLANLLNEQAVQPRSGIGGALANFASGFGGGYLSGQEAVRQREQSRQVREATAALLEGRDPDLAGLNDEAFQALAPQLFQVRQQQRQALAEQQKGEREFMQRYQNLVRTGLDPESEEARRYLLTGMFPQERAPGAPVQVLDAQGRAIYVRPEDAIGRPAPRRGGGGGGGKEDFNPANPFENVNNQYDLLARLEALRQGDQVGSEAYYTLYNLAKQPKLYTDQYGRTQAYSTNLAGFPAPTYNPNAAPSPGTVRQPSPGAPAPGGLPLSLAFPGSALSGSAGQRDVADLGSAASVQSDAGGGVGLPPPASPSPPPTIVGGRVRELVSEGDAISAATRKGIEEELRELGKLRDSLTTAISRVRSAPGTAIAEIVGGRPKTADAVRLNTALTAVVTQTKGKAFADLGVPTGQDLELLQALIGTPNRAQALVQSPEERAAGLEALMELTQQRIDNAEAQLNTNSYRLPQSRTPSPQQQQQQSPGASPRSSLRKE